LNEATGVGGFFVFAVQKSRLLHAIRLLKNTVVSPGKNEVQNRLRLICRRSEAA
jgi:hypothetical protein